MQAYGVIGSGVVARARIYYSILTGEMIESWPGAIAFSRVTVDTRDGTGQLYRSELRYRADLSAPYKLFRSDRPSSTGRQIRTFPGDV